MPRRRGKPQGRVARIVERVALGAIMTVAAFVVERRLLKVIRKRGGEETEPARSKGERPGAATEEANGGLSVSTQEVDEEPGRHRPAEAAQDHRHPSDDV
jgi:flagellar biosynthesis/type III secretory pathway M-ring protein FliF/YscJ